MSSLPRLAALAFGLSFAAASLAADEAPLARIDGAQLSAQDIEALLKPLDPAARAKLTGNHQQLVAVVRAELGRRAVMDAIRAAKFEQKPDVQQALARAHDDALINLYIASVAVPPASYPSDDEVKQAYEANLTRFMLPRQYHLAQIFIAKTGSAEAAQRKAKADEIAKKARAAGANFAQLARDTSEDTGTSAGGGDLGWVPETSLLPEVAGSIKSATDGEVIGPIETPQGWHIVQLSGTKPAGPQPLEAVKSALTANLRQQRANQEAELFINKLLSERHAAINEIALDKLAGPAKP